MIYTLMIKKKWRRPRGRVRGRGGYDDRRGMGEYDGDRGRLKHMTEQYKYDNVIHLQITQ